MRAEKKRSGNNEHSKQQNERLTITQTSKPWLAKDIYTKPRQAWSIFKGFSSLLLELFTYYEEWRNNYKSLICSSKFKLSLFVKLKKKAQKWTTKLSQSKWKERNTNTMGHHISQSSVIKTTQRASATCNEQKAARRTNILFDNYKLFQTRQGKNKQQTRASLKQVLWHDFTRLNSKKKKKRHSNKVN